MNGLLRAAGRLVVTALALVTTMRARGDKPSATAVLIGAGDIANCADLGPAEATAKLLEANPGTVMAIGDLAYSGGTKAEFANCYDKTWGRVKERTRPVPGNHEFHSKHALGYAEYWAGSAGAPAGPDKYYYSYDLGAWHIVALDRDCKDIGGCQRGSDEEQWLRNDLAAHPAACTLAYFHHPLFSSGHHGNDPDLKDLWQALYDHHADIVVNGHDHSYERFAAQDPDGKADAAHGIREFVAGTGGKDLRPFEHIQPNSEVRNAETHGVLKLTLHNGSYDWRFIPVAGENFTDSGSGTCH